MQAQLHGAPPFGDGNGLILPAPPAARVDDDTNLAGLRNRCNFAGGGALPAGLLLHPASSSSSSMVGSRCSTANTAVAGDVVISPADGSCSAATAAALLLDAAIATASSAVLGGAVLGLGGAVLGVGDAVAGAVEGAVVVIGVTATMDAATVGSDEAVGVVGAGGGDDDDDGDDNQVCLSACSADSRVSGSTFNNAETNALASAETASHLVALKE